VQGGSLVEHERVEWAAELVDGELDHLVGHGRLVAFDLTWVTSGWVRRGSPVFPGILVGVGARSRH
jgi:hypothetical protein